MKGKNCLKTIVCGLLLALLLPLSASTYYLQSTGNAPWPYDPYNGEMPVSVVDEARGIYLVEDVGTLGMRGMSLDFPLPGEGGTNDYIEYTNTYTVDTNGLWLSVEGLGSYQLHNATNEVYAILSKTNLLETDWKIEGDLWPTNAETMPFTLATVPDSLFVWAQDWTGVTSGDNTVPDWWLWRYFGTTALADTNVDGLGRTLREDYTNDLDPNLILFIPQFPGSTTTNDVEGKLLLLAGMPAYLAVLVNDTNTAHAAWQPYDGTNVTVALGTAGGIYSVRLGLKGLPVDASQTWQEVKIAYVPTTPLLLGITDFASPVSVPLIQLQGWVNQTLSGLTYDVSNAAGITTNLTGYWQPEFYDTNTLKFTTNSFQCYDVILTNGLNQITLRATDLNGLTLTTNFTVTLDTSGDTQAPGLTLVWPTNGMKVAGSNVTVQATVDDATATVAAFLNGDTNAVQGLVDRDGNVWFDSLPLAAGTNLLILTAIDYAGNASTNVLELVAEDLGLVIDPVELGNETAIRVSGAVGDAGHTVTVNGVVATVNEDGTWSADNVPVTATGVAGIMVQVNDGVNTVEQTVYEEQPATVALMSYVGHSHWNVVDSTYAGFPFFTVWHGEGDEAVIWSYQKGGSSSISGFMYYCDTCADNGPSSSFEAYPAGIGGLSLPWEQRNMVVVEDERAGGGGYRTTQYQTQSKVMVVPGGRSGTGGTAMYLVQAQVSDEDSGLQLPGDQVKIRGQSLTDVTNSEGQVWSEALISAPAGARLEITPTAEGHPNLSFSGMKTAKTKEDWQKMVRTEINQDSKVAIQNYLAAKGFMNNRANIKAVYAFYQKLFTDYSTWFYWAGLAKLAGAPVYAGLSDAEYCKEGIITSGFLTVDNLGVTITSVVLAYKAAQFQTDLIQMNIDIYSDLAWQFEAYKKGGLDALENINAVNNNALDINAWRKIDDGIQNDDDAEIQRGNTLLAQREQNVVLVQDYQNLSDLFPGTSSLMSRLAQNPVIGGPDFLTLEPGGDLANTIQRWDWVSRSYANIGNTGIFPLWLQESSASRLIDVQEPLLTRALQFSYVYNYISTSLTLY